MNGKAHCKQKALRVYSSCWHIFCPKFLYWKGCLCLLSFHHQGWRRSRSENVKMYVLLLQPFGAKNQHLSYSLLHTSLPSPIHTMLICVLFSAPSQPSPPPFSPPNYKALSAGLSVLHWGVQGIGRHMAVWSFYAHPHRKPPWISTYFRDNVLVSFKC